jgi:hypothetical protein
MILFICIYFIIHYIFDILDKLIIRESMPREGLFNMIDLKKILRSTIYLFAYPLLFRVSKFKDLHLGEEVYIIADSSELRFIELKQFDDKPAIFFNMSFFIEGVINRKQATYGHFIESFYFFNTYSYKGKKYNIAKIIKNYLKSSNMVFFTYLTNILNFPIHRVYYLFQNLPGDIFTSYEKKNNEVAFRWSIKTAISLAIYMGFKRAYIIGFSFHDKALEHHWYDFKKIEKKTNLQYESVVEKLLNKKVHNEFFNNAKKRIELVGLTVFNPSKSYLEYQNIFYKNGVKRLPIEPINMTSWTDALIFRALEKKDFNSVDLILNYEKSKTI